MFRTNFYFTDQWVEITGLKCRSWVEPVL